MYAIERFASAPNDHSARARPLRAACRAIEPVSPHGETQLAPSTQAAIAYTRGLDQLPRGPRRSHFGRALTEATILSLGRGDALHFDDVLGDEVAGGVRLTALRMDADGALGAGGVKGDASANFEIRGDRMAWLDPLALPLGLAPVIDLFGDVMLALNERAYLGARTLDIQISVFRQGHGYARHRDATTSASSRRATAIYYANYWEPGDGGELEVWDTVGTRLLAPLANRLVVFRSQCTQHAVRAIVGQPRVAVSAFMHN